MPPRVLIVEDSPDIQAYCKMVLEEAGYVVDACGTAAQARRLYDAARPDLAILDIGLPDGSGLELVKEWRELPGEPAPVMFLTARGDVKTRLECFRLGAQDYMQKPFAAEELLARTKAHLRAKQSHDELVRRNYELELITRARQDMTDMIVHDLKSPLTSIRGTLELVMARGLISQENYAALIDRAGSEADFILLMLNDLLDVGQAQKTGLKTDPQPIDVPALFGKLRTLFAQRLRERKISLITHVQPGGEKISSDQNLLYRILANLIAAAMQTAKSGEAVELVCTPSPTGAHFNVTGANAGVDADANAGIGLSFCRAAASALGGRLRIEGAGANRFVLELPSPPA